MSAEPATTFAVLTEPNGKDTVMLHQVDGGLTITQAIVGAEGGHEVVETITIEPDMLEAFAEAVPAAVDAVLASGRAGGPAGANEPSTSFPAEGAGR